MGLHSAMGQNSPCFNPDVSFRFEGWILSCWSNAGKQRLTVPKTRRQAVSGLEGKPVPQKGPFSSPNNHGIIEPVRLEKSSPSSSTINAGLH